MSQIGHQSFVDPSTAFRHLLYSVLCLFFSRSIRPCRGCGWHSHDGQPLSKCFFGEMECCVQGARNTPRSPNCPGSLFLGGLINDISVHLFLESSDISVLRRIKSLSNREKLSAAVAHRWGRHFKNTGLSFNRRSSDSHTTIGLPGC